MELLPFRKREELHPRRKGSEKAGTSCGKLGSTRNRVNSTESTSKRDASRVEKRENLGVVIEKEGSRRARKESLLCSLGKLGGRVLEKPTVRGAKRVYMPTQERKETCSKRKYLCLSRDKYQREPEEDERN